jgi:hypothetical protein
MEMNAKESTVTRVRRAEADVDAKQFQEAVKEPRGILFGSSTLHRRYDCWRAANSALRPMSGSEYLFREYLQTERIRRH